MLAAASKRDPRKTGQSALALLTGLYDFIPVQIIADERRLTSNMDRKIILAGKFPEGTAIKTAWGWFVTRQGAIEALGPPRKRRIKKPRTKKAGG
jgi:hypothetical protein